MGLAGLARRAERLEALVKKIEDMGSQALAVATDVTDEAAVQNLFDQAVARFGTVDVLINNAGIADSTPVDEMALELWNRVIQTNLTSAFLCSRAAFRVMKGKGRGRIINIVSLSGQEGGVGRSAYGASKAGLEVLTTIMAVELADHEVNVNAIAPGPIMTEVGRTMHTKETVEAYHRLIPQRRYGEPEEIAAAAVFLASGTPPTSSAIR